MVCNETFQEREKHCFVCLLVCLFCFYFVFVCFPLVCLSIHLFIYFQYKKTILKAAKQYVRKRNHGGNVTSQDWCTFFCCYTRSEIAHTLDLGSGQICLSSANPHRGRESITLLINRGLDANIPLFLNIYILSSWEQVLLQDACVYGFSNRLK